MRHGTHHRLLLLLLFGAIGSIPNLRRCEAGEKVLRWRFQPGQTIQVDMQQQVQSEQQIFGRTMNSTADMAIFMHWRVNAVDPSGEAEIEQALTRVRMKMTAPGSQPMEFDTSSEQEPEGLVKTIRDNVAPLIGLRLVQRMNGRGEILDVRVAEKSDSGSNPATGADGGAAPFSKEELQAMLSQSAAVLPEGPVKPGDQWSAKSETASPFGSLVTSMTYTYAGTETREGRPLERINVAISVGIAESSANNGLQIRIKEQNSQGIMWFDAAAGRFVETDLDQRMTLVSSFGDANHEQQVAMKMRIQFTSGAAATAETTRGGTAARPVSTRASQPTR